MFIHLLLPFRTPQQTPDSINWNNGHDIVTDHVKKLGFDLFFYLSMTKNCAGVSETREGPVSGNLA